MIGSTRDEEIDLEKATNNRTYEFWKANEFQNYNKMMAVRYQEKPPIEQIVSTVKQYIQEQQLEKSTILEIGSGDGFKTKIFQQSWTIPIIATDILELTPSYYNVEKMPSHEAVKKYDGKFDILLMVYPLPGVYMDYYAIKEFELSKNSSKPKHLIYVGELGAADGGPGMYNYLLNHADWKLQKRVVFDAFKDIFDMPSAREIFIFKI
jgi:hypothetical protein